MPGILIIIIQLTLFFGFWIVALKLYANRLNRLDREFDGVIYPPIGRPYRVADADAPSLTKD